MNKLVKTENEHLYASGGLIIPHEVADGITLATLQDQHNYLKEELRAHLVDGAYLHKEDAYNSQFKLIPALGLLIAYFGGDTDPLE
jgi:hypothetical protein